jgi:UDP-N-acetylmuramyl pentapeptide phosphotransferase/UDP-N-acetylglucosamine-1-phosphate transferase
MNVERSKKVFYRFIGWFLSLLVLVVVTIIFYFVMESKALNLIDAIEGLDTHPDDEDYQRTLEGAVALVYIMLILIVLFNKLLMVVLFHKFTDM